jgi:aminoglycoside 3-N-acetyltransferase
MNDHLPLYYEIPEMLPFNSHDTVLIASDISKIAYQSAKTGKPFEADKFIDSLQKKLKDGTLLFPAFVNHTFPHSTFDILNSAPETGLLSLRAFRRNDFVRTSDPIHSFMVWGKSAAELAELKNNSTFGANSPFGFLHRKAGKMLLIDIDLQHSFTFAHYVEECEQVSYRKWMEYTILCRGREGNSETRKIQFYGKKSGVMINLDGLKNIFLKNGAASEFKINDSCFTIIDLQKSFDLIRQDIRTNKAANLHRTSVSLFIKTLTKKLIS